jgi:predicted porin
MKKTLVALAALAATTAFAQSTVTISGNVDLGYKSTKLDGYSTVTSGIKESKKTNAPNGNGAAGWTSSALGLDISEDLGNGMKAGYSTAIDMFSFAPTADASAGTASVLQNSRHSFISLSDAKMGELRAGYQYTLDDQIQGGVGRATPTGNIGGRIQNFGNIGFTVTPNTAAATSMVYREGTDVFTSGAITRNNAFQYASPVMSGVQVMAQFATQAEDKTRDGSANAGKTDGKVQAIAAKYNQGPLNLGFAYTKATTDTNTLAVSADAQKKVQAKLYNYAANYDLGSAKVFYNYFKRNHDITGAGYVADATRAQSADKYVQFGNGGSIERKGYDLGVSAPFGKTTLFASMGKGSYTANLDAATTGDKVTVKGRVLGVSYELSKRTSLNAYYTTTKASVDSTELKNTIVGGGLRHQF